MKRLEFEVRLGPDHPSLQGHFPGNPVVPGVVLLDAVIAHVESATGHRVEEVQQAKFHSALRPGESAVVECFVHHVAASFRATTRRGPDSMQVISGALALASAPSDSR